MARSWPFRVTRRHRSRDHSNPRYSFAIGTSWAPSPYVQPCPDNGHQKYWGHDLDLSGSRDVISHVTIRIPMGISIRFRDIWPWVYWGTTLTFQGQVTSSVTWLFDSQVVISYWCSIGTKSVSPTVVEIMNPKYIAVMTLSFLGHVTSSVTWPFASQWAISYWWSVGPKSLSPAVFEIFAPKYISVTTLTFLGHVTSSVTWPFESQWVISSISIRFRDIWH